MDLFVIPTILLYAFVIVPAEIFFAGLFGAALSVALATLGIAVYQHGTSYAALQSFSMMAGAIALAVYSVIVCRLLIRARL